MNMVESNLRLSDVLAILGRLQQRTVERLTSLSPARRGSATNDLAVAAVLMELAQAREEAAVLSMEMPEEASPARARRLAAQAVNWFTDDLPPGEVENLLGDLESILPRTPSPESVLARLDALTVEVAGVPQDALAAGLRRALAGEMAQTPVEYLAVRLADALDDLTALPQDALAVGA